MEWRPLKKKLGSLEDTGSKHSGKVEGSHAVVLMVALHKGEEVTKVAEETVVDVWKLLDQVSHIWPRAIITALYRHTTRWQRRSKVRMWLDLFIFHSHCYILFRNTDTCSSAWSSFSIIIKWPRIKWPEMSYMSNWISFGALHKM